MELKQRVEKAIASSDYLASHGVKVVSDSVTTDPDGTHTTFFVSTDKEPTNKWAYYDRLSQIEDEIDDISILPNGGK